MSAQDKLSLILAALAAGKTVYIQTATHVFPITPKTAAKFSAVGMHVFRATDKSLYMARGKHWDCIDYCGIATD